MKADELFINLARGGVVDEDALVKALEAGEIAALRSTCFKRSRCPSSIRSGR